MSTLDTLWEKLGLDSLPEDTGQPDDFKATRTRDWRLDTLKVFRPELVQATERTDLPRLSISPPVLLAPPDRPNVHQDLIIVGMLGEGGMGRVLLARQQSIGREVAVKVPRAGATDNEVHALVHEARTTGALEHPGVIPVYTLASNAGGQPALVMKRVDGVAWHSLVHDPQDPAWDRLSAGADQLLKHVEILAQVCNAVGFAHSRGILHRDVKPTNVLIGEFGEVYVADWGVAIGRAARLEHTHSLVGTPVYLAPEMVMGDDAQMDERSDVFLLGATLYEVLTRRAPYEGQSLHAVLRNAWECNPAPLPDSVPVDLARICRKAMARRPADRFQSAIEVRDALLGWVRHRGAVQLTTASQARLDALGALVAEHSQDRALIYPLISECRFGFTQALHEWPENAAAAQGLRESLLTAARFEVSLGNAEAARALLTELKEVPPELEAAVKKAEAVEASLRSQKERLRHLSQEMDPRVAVRQRVLLLATIGLCSVVIVGVQALFPSVHQFVEGLGPFHHAITLGLPLLIFLFGLWLGRKGLLGTRLNRRVAGLVAVALFGPLVNRLLAGWTLAPTPQVISADLLMIATVCATGGFMMHWSFFVSAATFVVGAVAAIALPSVAQGIFAVTSVLAISSLVFSFRRWRNELWLAKE